MIGPAPAAGLAVEAASPGRRNEDLADRIVHVGGVAASIVGVLVLAALAFSQTEASRTVTVLVYGGALVATLGCSALYNMLRESERGELLRRLDHAAIFIMIAATYTPFLVVKMGDGAWGPPLLVFVWTAAAAGAWLKLTGPRRFDRWSVAFYQALGWTIVVAIEPLARSVSVPALVLLGTGGLLYSAGVVFYLWDGLPYQRAIWHALVLAGAACHYAAVLGEIALPGGFA